MEPKKLFKYVAEKKNVIGKSNYFQDRIRNGKVVKGEKVFRIYVSEKLPVDALKRSDIVPKKIKGIETDIVALEDVHTFTTDRTARIRDVPLAVSVANEKVTAGSLGMLYNHYIHGLVAGSNAHVLAPDPTSHPAEVRFKLTSQPGSAHDPNVNDNKVGDYLWHDTIITPQDNPCPVAKTIVKALNVMSRFLGRESRFETYDAGSNNHDFGVYTPSTKHVLEVPDVSLDGKKFAGHLFAGSKVIGVIGKVKYAIERGYYPCINPTIVQVGDVVEGYSFWGDYKTVVTDDSASLQVGGYGRAKSIALFDDVILVKNEDVIRGGWSGSGFYVVGV